jgi:haloacetate dehalogenase
MHKLSKLHPNLFERCGHLPQEEQSEAANRLLLDFLDGCAVRTVKRMRRAHPMRVEIGQEMVFPTGRWPICVG